MPTINRLAEVLEKAADLYESETVDWCQGKWGRLDADTGVLSLCASSALAVACGLTQSEAEDLEAWIQFNNTDKSVAVPAGYRGIAPQITTYIRARQHLDQVLSERAVGAEAAHTGLIVTTPWWNDNHVTLTKAEVVETFKDVAKDLRNAQ